MKRIVIVAVLGLFFSDPAVHGQTPAPLSFFPYRAGNVWQYRDGFNGQILYTRYNDVDSVGNDSSIYIRGRFVPESPLFEKIDTSYCLYNLRYQSEYPRYKLAADSGDSWVAGAGIITPDDTLVVTVTDVFQDRVFGVLTTFKVFTAEIVRPPPQPTFWLGDDYLASGFGLVASFIEPGQTVYLAGALIDSVRWGFLVNVNATDQSGIPNAFTLNQNYPNPFNPLTTIGFDVPRESHVVLSVYDILGQHVRTLVDDRKEIGSYSVPFFAQLLCSGVYFYRLESDETVITKRMILQK